MEENYLKGIIGDQINAMMAAAAWNFKKWMRAIVHSFLCRTFYILQIHKMQVNSIKIRVVKD